MKTLTNKNILLGVTGGIAAYKSADLTRRLIEAGATVQVVMTASAQEFITPLTLQAVSGLPVRIELFDTDAEAAMGHIELARWADLILVAPASADFLARLAGGRADDLLTTLCLASKAPVAVAPAMNQVMWSSSLTQQNLKILHAHQIQILGPGEGSQACGDVGLGRLLEPIEIVKVISENFKTESLAGVSVLITAGPTHEAIDPVRFISNASSGKMGYALALAAEAAGAKVTLISGPVNHASLPKLSHTKIIDVTTAAQMHSAVIQRISKTDLFIAAAAVADYTVTQPADQKIAKSAETLSLSLERTIDIVSSVTQMPNKPFVVGFAAETQDVIQNAKAKAKRKNLDMIVANQVGEGLGFNTETNAATLLWGEHSQTFEAQPKEKLARALLQTISEAYLKRKVHA